MYDGELRRELFEYETNVATVFVTTLTAPGVPGPITGPANTSSGTYSLAWGAASGVVSRYELFENGAMVYSGTALTATVTGRLDGVYTYAARACNAAGCGALTAAYAVTVQLSLTEAVNEDLPIFQPTVPAQGWVGTIPGSPSVEGGAAGYRISIDVPPGRVGMQPDLALVYGSRNGNGIAGVGWALSGTSSIYRCPRTLAQDGGNAPVRLTSEDRLCFDGVRLVAAAGTYGLVGSEYRSEIDPFDRVTLKGGGTESSGSYFDVEHKSGRISRFVAAVKNSAFPPDTWRIARRADPQGNCILYNYAQFNTRGSDVEWVLSSIAYTTGTMSGDQCIVGADARSIEFLYTNDRPDKRTTNVSGVPSAMTARLAAVVTKVGAQAVRRYELAYKVSGATERTLLQSVTLCPTPAAGAACGVEALPPTLFSYEEGPATFERQQLTEVSGQPAGPEWRVMLTSDFDGDGTRDKILSKVTTAGWSRWLVLSKDASATSLDGTPDGTKWFEEFDSPLDTIPGAGSDVDNDGRADLIGTVQGYLAFASLKNGGWVITSSNFFIGVTSPDTYTRASTIDYDGDGRLDILISDGTNALIYPRLCKDRLDCFGTPFATPARPSADHVARMMRDMNGDGLVDTFFDGWKTAQNPPPQIAFFQGNGQPYVYKTLGELGGPNNSFAETPYRRWLDVNGDGLPDIYEPGTIWLNRGGVPGTSMFKQMSVVMPTLDLKRAILAFVMDVDGDGQDELMVPTIRVLDFCGGDLTKSLPSGDPYWWCGDEFDRGDAVESYDMSVFLLDAYKFHERSDGTYELVRVGAVGADLARNLQAPVRFGALPVDWFGDGLSDVQYMLVKQYGNTTQYYPGLPDGQYGSYVSRNLAHAPDLLKSVTNGLGATAAWTHQPLSQGSFPPGCEFLPNEKFYVAHHDAARSPGYLFFTSSMWAVSKFEISNGLGSLRNSSCYRYEDAMLNAEGRGFQGFKMIVTEERLPPAGGEVAGVAGTCTVTGCSANNLRTTTEFNQEFPLTNRVKRVLVERVSDPRLIAETKQWWHAMPGSVPGTWVVYPSATIEKKYDLAGVGGTLLSTGTSVQDLMDPVSGEVARSCSIIEDETRPPGDARRMTVAQEDRVFEANDTSAWWLAKIKSRTKTSDFRSSAFIISDPPATMPVACPPLPATTNAKIHGTSYTWHATRKLESEALFNGPVPGAAETPACFPPSTAGEERSCFEYDPYGNVVRKRVRARDVLDALGNPNTLLTTYTMSVDSYFTQTETNPAGHVSTVLSDPATGQPTYRQAVQGGPTTTTQYDSLGRALTMTTDGAKPIEHRQLACTTLATPGVALPSCDVLEVMARADYQAGAPTHVEYLDVFGRELRSVAEGYNGSFVVQTEVAFNERGIKVAEYAPRWLDAARYETRYSGFDAIGRMGRKEVDRDPGLLATGQGEATLATDYVHEKFKTSITVHKPAQGGALEMSRTYDARGRLVETTQRVAGPGSNEALTQYLYDPTGALTNIRSGSRRADGTWAIDPTTIDLVAVYDNLGRKTEVRDPDRGVWRYTWDGLGRLKTQTDARGNVTTQVYDDIGRPKERTSTANGETPLHAVWTWDQGQPGVLNRLDSNDGYSREYRYDSLVRPEKVIFTLPEMDAVATSSRVFAVEYGYDRRTGWLKAKRYPNLDAAGGEKVLLDYSDRGFALGETELLASYTRGKQYRRVTAMDARGQVLLQDFGNGIAEATTHDASTGLMLDVQATRSTGSLIRATHYRYDHFLNLTWQEKTIPPLAPTKVTETFAYDDLQRILSASRAWVGLTGESPPTDSYAYDDLGNITSKSDYGLVYTYGGGASATCPAGPRTAGPHAVTSVAKIDGSTATLTYDCNGNLFAGDGRTVGFDLMDRPVRVCSGDSTVCAPGAALPGATSEFSYAPDGARYRQVVSGAVDPSFGPKTVYSVDKDYELTVWKDGTTEERSYLSGSVVVYRKGDTREVRYLHLDRLGSVDAATKDDTGATELFVDAHGFDPWGKPRAREWTVSGARLHPAGDAPAQAVTTDRGFTGHEHLDVHYLIHMNGRAYDYRLGRFLSVDPIISNPLNSQSINPYSYIGNNPLSGIDPTGYECVKVTGSNICNENPIGNVTINGNHIPNNVVSGPATQKPSPSTTTNGAPGQGAKTPTANPAEHGSPQDTARGDSGVGATSQAPETSQQGKEGSKSNGEAGFSEKLGNFLRGDGWKSNAEVTNEQRQWLIDHKVGRADAQGNMTPVEWATASDRDVAAAYRYMQRVLSAAKSNEIRAAAGIVPAITFGHGARHLAGTALKQADVETAIKQDIEANVKSASATGQFWGRVRVHGKAVEYRAFTLPSGTVNVGTYYILP